MLSHNCLPWLRFVKYSFTYSVNVVILPEWYMYIIYTRVAVCMSECVRVHVYVELAVFL